MDGRNRLLPKPPKEQLPPSRLSWEIRWKLRQGSCKKCGENELTAAAKESFPGCCELQLDVLPMQSIHGGPKWTGKLKISRRHPFYCVLYYFAPFAPFWCKICSRKCSSSSCSFFSKESSPIVDDSENVSDVVRRISMKGNTREVVEIWINNRLKPWWSFLS